MPGLDAGYRLLTRVLPLGRVAVTERGGEPYLADSGRAQGRRAPGQLDGKLTETGSNDVTEAVELPGPDEPVSFAAHIRPLFRERDKQSMSWASTWAPTTTCARAQSRSWTGWPPGGCP